MPASPALILLATFLLAVVMFTLMWQIHVAMRDASVVDYYWAAGFVVIAAAAVAMSAPLSPVQALFVLAVVVWATRLTGHIVRRHRRAGAEDGRYRRLRAKGGPGFWWKSLFSIFLLQAVLQWLVATPVVVAIALARTDPDMVPMGVGFALYALGLGLETAADRQLARHREDPARAGSVLDRGLWAWSRHPNYLGEIILWWGLSLVAYGLSGSLWAFAGPALLTGIIATVSIRLTEEHAAGSRAGFADYRARTSPLVPWPRSPAETTRP